jgi:hydroxylamine dehydrogenase
MEWERSTHSQRGVGCLDCHGSEKTKIGSWLHEGFYVSVLVTPKDCSQCHEQEYKEFSRSHHARAGDILASLDNVLAEKAKIGSWLHEGFYVSVLVTPIDCSQCHEQEYKEFSRSHHARAGDILASLDNVLAEKAAGMPGNIADAVNGCWQCHGTIIKFKRDAKGDIVREGKENKPVIAADTWPNSGIGRLNPDGSKGSCNACHSRHSFEAKLARAPENCGKCHMGPDHP